MNLENSSAHEKRNYRAPSVALIPGPGQGPLHTIIDTQNGKLQIWTQVDGKPNRTPEKPACEDAVRVESRGKLLGICVADGVGAGTSNEATRRFANAIARSITNTLTEEIESLPDVESFQKIVKETLMKVIEEETANNSEEEILAASVLIALFDTSKRIGYVLHLGDGFCGELDQEGIIHPFFKRKELLPRTEQVDQWQRENDSMDKILNKLVEERDNSGLTMFVSGSIRRRNRWKDTDLVPSIAHINWREGSSLLFASDGLLKTTLANLNYHNMDTDLAIAMIYAAAKASGHDDTCMAAVYLG